MSKARILLELGRAEEAIEVLDQAIPKNYSYMSECYVLKAKALRLLGKDQEADTVFVECISNYNNFIEALQITADRKTLQEMLEKKAFALFDFGKDADAIETVDQLIQIVPGSNALIVKARALSRLERFDESLAAYDQLIRFGGANSYRGYLGKIHTLSFLGRVEEKLSVIGEFIADCPDQAIIYFNETGELDKLIQETVRLGTSLQIREQLNCIRMVEQEHYRQAGICLKLTEKKVKRELVVPGNRKQVEK